MNLSVVSRSRVLPECDLQEVHSLKAFIAYDSIASLDRSTVSTKPNVPVNLRPLIAFQRGYPSVRDQIWYIFAEQRPRTELQQSQSQ